MDYFNYKNGQLYAEDVPVADLAERYGTPLYVYSRATLERHWRVFDSVLSEHPHCICYAVKANSNIAILQVLAKLGSGFDIVSVGELERVLAAGGDPKKTVFSGVGKLQHEIVRALEVDISCFNVESAAELERINSIAADMQKTANIALRVNPDINANTHPYISTGLKENKFGIPIQDAPALYQKAAGLKHVKIIGVTCHIGSQLTDLAPFLEACDKVFSLAVMLKQQGINIEQIDLGGGLGVRYLQESPPEPAEYAAALLARLPDKNLRIILEPGRAIAANAGILVTRVEYLKPGEHKHFAITDAGMNDLLRPALYHAEQNIIPVIPNKDQATAIYDIVGPVCETGDFLGKQRELALNSGDLLAVRTAGAYGFTMSSNYNSRPRAAEVLIAGDQSHLIRQRETIAQLFANESLVA